MKRVFPEGLAKRRKKNTIVISKALESAINRRAGGRTYAGKTLSEMRYFVNNHKIK